MVKKKTLFNKIINNLKLNTNKIDKYDNKTTFKLKTNMIGKKYKGTSSISKDSVLMMTHPGDKNLKLMVIASGEGKIYNINSSKYTTQKIKQWFNNLDSGELKELSINFKESIDCCMKNISKNLSDVDGNNGTSVVLAIIGPEYTCVANIGNLRCYISKEGSYNMMEQVNEEDSELWEKYRSEYFTDKEEFRFHRNKDMNVNKIGLSESSDLGFDNFSSCYYLETSSFDRLYLFSRGIIESISEDMLNYINDKYSPSDGIKKLMELSTDGKTEIKDGYDYWNEDYEPITHGDKDASVCVLVKK